jgi:hypothetical protein
MGLVQAQSQEPMPCSAQARAERSQATIQANVEAQQLAPARVTVPEAFEDTEEDECDDNF